MIVVPEPDNSFDKYDELRLHMEALYRIKLVEHDLSLRILIPLEAAGIKTIGDLVKRSREELLQINRLGVGAVGTLEKYLDNLDLALRK